MAGIEGLLIGRVLGGRYRIEEVIGRGGMGAVYRAIDERLGRPVAVKVITTGAGTGADARERLQARFLREARSAAALPHHPNVVPVYDYGSDEGLDLDYIVMELLRGSDLATRLARQGPPPLAASLKILLEAARGIAVGHRQGLIHRDVKPGNIFLTEAHRSEVQVRVVDFGIAKVADDEDTLGHLTQEGGVPHSPAFASPEQLRGLSHLTPASDVFSLGAVGFQLLAGERPFSDSDRNRMSLGMPVPAPSLRERNPAIPGTIDAIVRKALAYEPADRFQDAGELAAALEDAIRHLGDAPLEPYIVGSTALGSVGRPSGADADTDEAHVPKVEPDDLTLIAPPTVPAAAPSAGIRSAPPTGPPLPPRKRPPEPRKRGVGGLIVWLMIVGVLTVAGVIFWSEMSRQPSYTLQPQQVDSLTLPDTLGAAMDTLDPLDALIANQEGLRFYDMGSYREAYTYFRRAVEISPEDPRFRQNLGYALMQLRFFEDAERELALSMELDPNPPTELYRVLGQAQLQIGDTISAERNLDEYLRRETRPSLRQPIQAALDRIRGPGVELLGEPVEPTETGSPSPPPGPVAPRGGQAQPVPAPGGG